jgi:hypothetical protein
MMQASDLTMKAVAQKQIDEPVEPGKPIEKKGSFGWIQWSCSCCRRMNPIRKPVYIGWHAELLADGQLLASAQSSNDARIAKAVEELKANPPPEKPTTNRIPLASPNKPFTSSNRQWGPEQATGKPDTLTAGDIPTAWASLQPDAGAEWLEVSFPNPVEIAEIRIRETYNPGAISKVSAFLDSQKEQILWSGRAKPAPAPHELSIVPREKTISNRVKIHLDTRRVKGWNEIDAVELVGTDGTRQWASKATASSTFAESTPPRNAALPPTAR